MFEGLGLRVYLNLPEVGKIMAQSLSKAIIAHTFGLQVRVGTCLGLQG